MEYVCEVFLNGENLPSPKFHIHEIGFPVEPSVNLIVCAGDEAFTHVKYALVGHEHGFGTSWFPKFRVKFKAVLFISIR